MRSPRSPAFARRFVDVRGRTRVAISCPGELLVRRIAAVPLLSPSPRRATKRQPSFLPSPAPHFLRFRPHARGANRGGPRAEILTQPSACRIVRGPLPAFISS